MSVAVDPPARRGRTRLPDGRALAWSEWGPEDGTPVLFSPGAATSSSLGFGADVLVPLGVRLVAIDRPGFGGSDPHPHRTLLDFAGDVGALCASRGLDDPAIVGFSQGAPFALACAAAGIVRAAAIVSGSDEIAAPELRATLPAELRALVDRVEVDPSGAEEMLRGMDAARFHAMVVSGSGAGDRAIYLEPTFDAAFRGAIGEAFAQGPDGYARDTVLAMGRWPFDPSRIERPVDLWYGERDASPVHSPDLGASLAARIPGARRTVVAGAGGAILWTHARAILGSLLALG